LSSINAIAALSLPAIGGHFNLNGEAYYLIEAIGNIAGAKFIMLGTVCLLKRRVAMQAPEKNFPHAKR
jgi:hypothetical protein